MMLDVCRVIWKAPGAYGRHRQQYTLTPRIQIIPATFRMLSQTLRSATAPTAARGGSNPQQIGLGVQVGSVDVKHTQGNTQPTGYITDLAIEGEGFFILGQGDNRLYTRAGMFGLDNGTEGNLVSLLNGERVLGYVADSDGVIDHSPS